MKAPATPPRPLQAVTAACNRSSVKEKSFGIFTENVRTAVTAHFHWLDHVLAFGNML